MSKKMGGAPENQEELEKLKRVELEKLKRDKLEKLKSAMMIAMNNGRAIALQKRAEELWKRATALSDMEKASLHASINIWEAVKEMLAVDTEVARVGEVRARRAESAAAKAEEKWDAADAATKEMVGAARAGARATALAAAGKVWYAHFASAERSTHGPRAHPIRTTPIGGGTTSTRAGPWGELIPAQVAPAAASAVFEGSDRQTSGPPTPPSSPSPPPPSATAPAATPPAAESRAAAADAAGQQAAVFGRRIKRLAAEGAAGEEAGEQAAAAAMMEVTRWAAIAAKREAEAKVLANVTARVAARAAWAKEIEENALPVPRFNARGEAVARRSDEARRRWTETGDWANYRKEKLKLLAEKREEAEKEMNKAFERRLSASAPAPAPSLDWLLDDDEASASSAALPLEIEVLRGGGGEAAAATAPAQAAPAPSLDMQLGSIEPAPPPEKSAEELEAEEAEVEAAAAGISVEELRQQKAEAREDEIVYLIESMAARLGAIVAAKTLKIMEPSLYDNMLKILKIANNNVQDDEAEAEEAAAAAAAAVRARAAAAAAREEARAVSRAAALEQLQAREAKELQAAAEKEMAARMAEARAALKLDDEGGDEAARLFGNAGRSAAAAEREAATKLEAAARGAVARAAVRRAAAARAAEEMKELLILVVSPVDSDGVNRGKKLIENYIKLEESDKDFIRQYVLYMIDGNKICELTKNSKDTFLNLKDTYQVLPQKKGTFTEKGRFTENDTRYRDRRYICDDGKPYKSDGSSSWRRIQWSSR